jgi:hypothetical protein
VIIEDSAFSISHKMLLQTSCAVSRPKVSRAHVLNSKQTKLLAEIEQSWCMKGHAIFRLGICHELRIEIFCAGLNLSQSASPGSRSGRGNISFWSLETVRLVTEM